MTYVLHYAPDNASLIIRLALLELKFTFETRLVDRRIKEQCREASLKLNPNGRIPLLETRHDTLFETVAILLWLANQHGALAPEIDQVGRGPFFTWLFWLSNTLHPTLRNLFYPKTYHDRSTEENSQDLHKAQERSLAHFLTLIDQEISREYSQPFNPCSNIFQLSLVVCLLWISLYLLGDAKEGFDLSAWPNHFKCCRVMELRESDLSASRAEGLGQTIFSNPSLPNPPRGSAL